MADNGINQEEFLNSLNTIIKSTFEGKDEGAKVHHKTLETLLNKIESLASKTDGTNVNLDSLVKAIKEEQSKKGSSRSEIGEVTKKLEDKIAELSKKESDLVDAINKQIKSNEDLTEAVKEASSTRGSKVVGTIPPGVQQSSFQWATQAHGATPQQPSQMNFTKVHASATEKLGDRIEKTFMGKTFWGKMVGALTDAMFASKMMQNTFTDVIKLGVLMLSNFMRNLFGKKVAGITAILTSILGAVIAAKGAGLLAKGGGLLLRGGGKFLGALVAGKGLGTATKVASRSIRAGVKVASTGVVSAVKGMGSAIKKGGAKVLEKGALKTLGKGALAAAKIGGKKIPVAGALIGAGLATGRAMSGDWKGAAGELASGIAGSIPGVGTAASIGIDAWLMKRDMDIASGKVKVGSNGKVGSKAPTKSTPSAPNGKLKAILKIISILSPIGAIIQRIYEVFKGGPLEGKSVWGKIGDFIAKFTGFKSTDGAPQAEASGSAQYSSEVLKEFDTHEVKGVYGRDPYVEGGKTKYRNHEGVDLAYSQGEKVPLKVGGKVIAMTETISGYGKAVIVDSGDAYQLYGHLDSYAPNIREGSQLKRGDIIGLAGSTGRSKAPHLHYEVRKKEKAGTVGSLGDFLSRKKYHTDPIAWERGKNKVEEESKVSSKGSVPEAAKPSGSIVIDPAETKADTKGTKPIITEVSENKSGFTMKEFVDAIKTSKVSSESVTPMLCGGMDLQQMSRNYLDNSKTDSMAIKTLYNSR